jgi:ABC-type multidrug transport system ATPase subunit
MHLRQRALTCAQQPPGAFVPSQKLLVIRRLTKQYVAGVRGCYAVSEVLRGASLELSSGEFATINGPPGSGKTTLLLCAAGLLRPDAGAVQWPGLHRERDRSPTGVAYVSERSPRHTFLTVRESLGYASVVDPARERVQRETSEVLRLAGLEAAADVRVGVLNHAERARLAIAHALLTFPRLLLIDDLLATVDPVARREVVACLAGFVSDGMGILWASRTPESRHGVDAAYVLDRGRVRKARRRVAAVHADVVTPVTSVRANVLPLQHADASG